MPGLARIDMEKSMQGCGIGDTQGRKEQYEQPETGALVASQFPEPLSREGDHYISNNETLHDTARKWNFCKSLAGFEMCQGAGALLEWLYLLKSAGRPERAQAPPSWKTIRRKPISPKNFWIASIPPFATFGLGS